MCCVSCQTATILSNRILRASLLLFFDVQIAQLHISSVSVQIHSIHVLEICLPCATVFPQLIRCTMYINYPIVCKGVQVEAPRTCINMNVIAIASRGPKPKRMLNEMKIESIIHPQCILAPVAPSRARGIASNKIVI